MTGYVHIIGFNNYFTLIISVYSIQHRHCLLKRPLGIGDVEPCFKETIEIHHFGKRILDDLEESKTH